LKLCLKSNIDERVANACLLAKDEYIATLLYQLDSGVKLTDMIFSGNFVEVIQRVNIQLENDKKKLESDLKNKELSWKRQKSKYEDNMQKMTPPNKSLNWDYTFNKADIVNDFNAQKLKQRYIFSQSSSLTQF
jgi:hypothetical protein